MCWGRTLKRQATRPMRCVQWLAAMAVINGRTISPITAATRTTTGSGIFLKRHRVAAIAKANVVVIQSVIDRCPITTTAPAMEPAPPLGRDWTCSFLLMGVARDFGEPGNGREASPTRHLHRPAGHRHPASADTCQDGLKATSLGRRHTRSNHRCRRVAQRRP